jgi:hypothetical protein
VTLAAVWTLFFADNRAAWVPDKTTRNAIIVIVIRFCRLNGGYLVRRGEDIRRLDRPGDAHGGTERGAGKCTHHAISPGMALNDPLGVVPYFSCIHYFILSSDSRFFVDGVS